MILQRHHFLYCISQILCARAHVLTCIYTCTSMYLETDYTDILPQSICTVFSEKGSLTEPEAHLFGYTGQPASLHVLRTWITGTQPFIWVPGIKCRSSCLHERHFTEQSITLAPVPRQFNGSKQRQGQIYRLLSFEGLLYLLVDP